MESLHKLGARKIAVTGMPPQGCVPALAPSVDQCNETFNTFVGYHNFFLNVSVSLLNAVSEDSPYHILDLNSSFTAVFNSGKFATPYQPCCVVISKDARCGDVDSEGHPLYKVCDDTKSAFYWDDIHPTQAGWRAAYDLALKHALEEIN
ncbi:hypothetical protein ACH5RR_007351 [Cinchona calisaya]|uniref:GDSL esterase/lipase n=1 Tax=Cinchona calisaya TaxID=153742 RepID=A0ABD3ARM1_9GENT